MARGTVACLALVWPPCADPCTDCCVLRLEGDGVDEDRVVLAAPHLEDLSQLCVGLARRLHALPALQCVSLVWHVGQPLQQDWAIPAALWMLMLRVVRAHAGAVRVCSSSPTNVLPALSAQLQPVLPGLFSCGGCTPVTDLPALPSPVWLVGPGPAAPTLTWAWCPVAAPEVATRPARTLVHVVHAVSVSFTTMVTLPVRHIVQLRRDSGADAVADVTGQHPVYLAQIYVHPCDQRGASPGPGIAGSPVLLVQSQPGCWTLHLLADGEGAGSVIDVLDVFKYSRSGVDQSQDTAAAVDRVLDLLLPADAAANVVSSNGNGHGSSNGFSRTSRPPSPRLSSPRPSSQALASGLPSSGYDDAHPSSSLGHAPSRAVLKRACGRAIKHVLASDDLPQLPAGTASATLAKACATKLYQVCLLLSDNARLLPDAGAVRRLVDTHAVNVAQSVMMLDVDMQQHHLQSDK